VKANVDIPALELMDVFTNLGSLSQSVWIQACKKHCGGDGTESRYSRNSASRGDHISGLPG